MRKIQLFLVAMVWISGLAAAEIPCPKDIQYTNGTYLKRGDNYFYNNGSRLVWAGNLYYPNGGYLKNGSNVYYSNGSYLQRNQDLFYPNGGRLKQNDNYFYANGQYLKQSQNFFYENGMWARRNGKLYRPDGTETPFPVFLKENIDSVGRVTAHVQASSDHIEVDFLDLLVSAPGAKLTALWNGGAFSQFEIVLNTGVAGENVFLRVVGSALQCSLDAPPGPTPQFKLFGPAGTLDVKLNPGYDPVVAREVLQKALDSIQER